METLVAFGKPWTYWIAPLVTLMAIASVLALFVGYLVKVVAAKYPKQ